ncbi:hypothetical protein [Planctomycetes bacterium TBK1r]|uniref:Uncharacterized protein n=1 Tax=Stieleria magnilauensis TaxID=2527963 RepID=A0ABX5XU74_9BACT|nr:hypothetical protein TBK1r_43250 [Planctomycetes bacterium TBK1r]
MLKKKMLLPAIILGVAVTFALSGEANAQCGYGLGPGVGHAGYGQVYRPTTRSYLGQGYQSYRPSYGYRQPVYHDTTHLDYHRPQVIPHGRHFHVQRGHFDVHRSGHWHH